MGNIQQSEKVLIAKINDRNEDLEEKFLQSIKRFDREAWTFHRNSFIKNLSKIILDEESGINPYFLNFCKDLLKAESEAIEKIEKIKALGEGDTISTIEFDFQKNFKITLLRNFGNLDEAQIQKIKKEAEFEVEHEAKKKEDNTFKQSNRYFGFHMNNVRAISNVGSSAMKATSNLANVLTKTAKLASNFSIIGITLTYLSAGIFDDEGTKMKKLTEKMANTLRKEVDFKIYTQSMDDLSAQINSISKMVDKVEKEINDYKEIEVKGKEYFEKIQLMVSLLELCDVIYEKIMQKKVYFKFALVFLQFLYFFIRIHFELLKLAISKFSIHMYNDLFKTYIDDYKRVFQDYHTEAKRIRSDSFIKKKQDSSFNIFSKVVANQYKVFEQLIDSYSSEVIISTEKTFTFNESVSGNVFANISTLYHEIDKFKPYFYDIEEILPKLKSEISVLLDERFQCILDSFNLFLDRTEKFEIYKK